MNDGFHAAASAMNAITTQLEAATHNAVNSRTPGYMNRVTVMRSFETALDRELGRESSLVHAEQVVSFRPGTLVTSPSPTSVALQGPGFLAVQTPDGPAFTRNGDLTVAQDGTLTTRAGYAVLGPAGPIRATTGGGEVRIGDGAQVFQGDQDLGTLRLVEFEKLEALVPVSETLFKAPPEAGERAAAATSAVAGMLELPPERAIAGLVGMIAANRDYEAAQRVTSVLNRTYERLNSRQG